MSDNIAVPPVIHDKCDVQLLDESVVCEMNAEVLECALNKCTGDKFICDCNVYEYVLQRLNMQISHSENIILS